jgi:hypothetical protein
MKGITGAGTARVRNLLDGAPIFGPQRNEGPKYQNCLMGPLLELMFCWHNRLWHGVQLTGEAHQVGPPPAPLATLVGWNAVGKPESGTCTHLKPDTSEGYHGNNKNSTSRARLVIRLLFKYESYAALYCYFSKLADASAEASQGNVLYPRFTFLKKVDCKCGSTALSRFGNI